MREVGIEYIGSGGHGARSGGSVDRPESLSGAADGKLSNKSNQRPGFRWPWPGHAHHLPCD
jgi:hypothetical protein